MEKRGMRRQQWTNIAVLLLLYDVIAINLAYGLALWLRFDMRRTQIPDEYMESWLDFLPIFTVLSILIFLITKLYRSIWSYVSIDEMIRVGIASILSLLIQMVGTCVFYTRMPVSFYVVGGILEFLFTLGVRFSYRFLRSVLRQHRNNHYQKRVMMVGAGEAGRILINEFKRDERVSDRVVCIIDDDPNKQGRIMSGIPVVGGRFDIQKAAEKFNVDKIVLAMPSSTTKEKKEILDICKQTKCELQILPGIYQFLNGEVGISKLKKVSIEDLLGREPIKVNLDEILGYVQDKVVLITGGGGSIGSELARQIASHNPKQLILLDIYENGVYDIQLELRRKYPNLNLVVLIGSVRNTHRMRSVFETYHPQIVYHAAAHKHVPLMEDSPNEAIKNNVLGTYKTASAAGRYHVEKFVLISTDKAVNPTNIMGASKRMCEMVIQTLNNYYPTEFVAVRFGNVLGSNGSVIPLFKKQIEEGGPLTVTHPDIIRYFMTIPEAVSLVLQAGAYAKGGEIFVLDMGEPVKIADLAKNLIRLSGLREGEDIKIEYTGLRPGEKLYEELLMDEEGMKKTENERIFIEKPIEFDESVFMRQLKNLQAYANDDTKDIRDMVREVVPTYHPADNK